MRPLSAVYLKEVTLMVDSEIIKNLALSSRETSETFGIVMRDIPLEYRDHFTIFSLTNNFNVDESVVTKSQCSWMAPFVHKLTIEINRQFPGKTAYQFFDRVFRTNHLDDLDVHFLKKKHFAVKWIQNLISITRRLMINTQALDQIPEFLQRCETVFFTHRDYNPTKLAVFDDNLNADMSIVLYLIDIVRDRFGFSVEKYIYFLDLPSRRARLRRIWRFYFTWRTFTDYALPEVQKLISFLSEHFPNLEYVSIGITSYNSICSSKTFAEGRLDPIKDQYDQQAATLLKISADFKGKLSLTMNSEWQVCKDKYAESFEWLDRMFSPKDPVRITRQNGRRTITNRRTKLNEKVDFICQRFVWVSRD